MKLIAGQNIMLKNTTLELKFDLGHMPSGLAVDTSAFALAANLRVRAIDDVINANNPILSDQGISRENDGQVFKFDLQKLPTDIAKVAVTISIEKGTKKRQTLALVRHVSAQLWDSSEHMLCEFRMETHGRKEVAMIMAEFYRHNQAWKFRAVGQGFNNGQQALFNNYGVNR